MERYAVLMTYPNGHQTYIRAGNSYPQVVAPFYDDAEDYVSRCRGNPGNERMTFEIVPYPYETVRA